MEFFYKDKLDFQKEKFSQNVLKLALIVRFQGRESSWRVKV